MAPLAASSGDGVRIAAVFGMRSCNSSSVGSEQRIRREAPLHRAVEQRVRERQQDHALVMRHVRADDRARLPARNARRRVVDRLEEAEAAGQAVGGEALQVAAGGFRRDHQRKGRSVRRDDQVLREPALQPQPRHAERAVLVVETRVDGVVAGLRDAPRHATLAAIGDLPVDGRTAGLVEQRALVGGHHEERHQVLEHRAAPGQQHRLPARRREQASQREPVLLRQAPLRDRDEAPEARLRREQVVIARIAPPLRDVVADRQQVPRRVVQEVVVQVRERLAFARKACDLVEPRGRIAARLRKRDAVRVAHRPRGQERRHSRHDGSNRLHVQRSQFAQRRHRSRREVARVGAPVQAPRREKRELLLDAVHLACERGGPEHLIARGRSRQRVRVYRDRRHPRADAIEPPAHGDHRRGPRIDGRFEVPAQPYDAGSRGTARRLGQAVERVAEPGEPRAHGRPFVREREQALPERQQVSGEVAAVDRGHVVRGQRLPRARVVPVVEVPFKPLERRHRRQRMGGTPDELTGRNEAQVERRQVREQCEPHVRRRRAVSDHLDRMHLHVVRRQPPIVRTHEDVEERPRPAREPAQETRLARVEAGVATTGRTTDPEGETGGSEPEQQHRGGRGQRDGRYPRQQDRPSRPRSPARSTSTQRRSRAPPPRAPAASRADGFHSSRWRRDT